MALPESFTGTNGTELNAFAAIWVSNTAHTGVMEIQSNKVVLRASPAASGCYLYDQLPASADNDVSAVINNASGIANGGVVGRASKTASTFYLARYNAGSLQLYKFVAGVATQLGGDVAQTVLNGVDYTITLSMAGNTIRLLWGGVQKISVTDSSIAANGYAGIRINANVNNLSFDNFDVTNMGGGTTHNITGANSQQANTASAGSVSQAASTFVTGSNSTQTNTASAGAVTQPAGGTIQLPPLAEWETDTLMPSETGITVWINDEESGALVLKLTGVTTAASTAAFDPISHASIVAATAYSVRTRLSDGVTQFTWTYVAT